MENTRKLGGAMLKDEPQKYKFKIREGSIKREHLDPAFVSIWDDVQKNATNVNTLQELLNQYYSTMQNAISFRGDKEVVPAGETASITFTFDCINTSHTVVLNVYNGTTLVWHDNVSVFPCQFTVSDASEGVYRCEANVDGIKYVGLWEVKASHDFWVGTGSGYDAVIANPSYKHAGASSLSGTYFLNPSAGDYIYIVCKSNVVPASVTISGFEVPMSIAETIEIDDVEYAVYQSWNSYQAVGIELVVNSVGYDNESYIAHLIEEIVSLKDVAEEVETIADEETLTMTENSKVALKNRRYVATTSEVQGNKGYIILEKGQTFKEQVEAVTEGNTIFEVRYDYDLDGETVEIPENCTLKFEGGQISNGTLVGNGTEIVANEVGVFSGIAISGTWKVHNIYSSWFADVTETNKIKQVFNLCDNDIYNHVYIEAGTYNVSLTPYYYVDGNPNPVAGYGVLLDTMTDVYIHNSGTWKLADNGYPDYSFLWIRDCKNIVVDGGEFYGDKVGHDYTTHQSDSYATHEWGRGIHVKDSVNVRLVNFTAHDFTGDGVNVGTYGKELVNKTENVEITGFDVHDCRRQGVTVAQIENLYIANFHIYGIAGTDPQAGIDIEPDHGSTHAGSAKNVTIENGLIETSKRGVIITHTNFKDTYHDNICIRNITLKDFDTDSSLIAVTNTKTAIVENIECVNCVASTLFAVRNAKSVDINRVSASASEIEVLINVANQYDHMYIGAHLKDVNVAVDDTVINVGSYSYDFDLSFDGCNLSFTTFCPTTNTTPYKHNISKCTLDGDFNARLSSARLDGNIMSSFNSGKIGTSGCTNSVVKNNTINGIVYITGTNVTFEDNIVTKPIKIPQAASQVSILRNRFIVDGSDNFSLVTSSGEISNVVYDGNVIDYTQASSYPTTVFNVSSNVNALTIKGNRIVVTDNTINYAIYSGSTRNILFENNVVVGAFKYGVSQSYNYVSTDLYLKKGTTAQRPTLDNSQQSIGCLYYDTDEKKCIVWAGTTDGWINVDGTALS